MRRQLVESLDRRKEQMIGSLWANSNYDDDKGTRQNAIEEIEAHYDQAVGKILGYIAEEEEEDIDESNPFFAPVKKGMDKIEVPRNPDGTVREAVNYNEFIDQ